jgi:hypothetical protein
VYPTPLSTVFPITDPPPRSGVSIHICSSSPAS